MLHYVVTDPDNNIAKCSFTVTILRLDIPPVVITCPSASPDYRIDTDPGTCTSVCNCCQPPVITDPCLTITYTMVNSYNNTDVADDTYPVGTTDITWTITDNSGGTTYCYQTVIVTDNEDPLITTCPATRNYEDCSTDAITGPIFSDFTAPSTYAEFSDATNGGEWLRQLYFLRFLYRCSCWYLSNGGYPHLDTYRCLRKFNLMPAIHHNRRHSCAGGGMPAQLYNTVRLRHGLYRLFNTCVCVFR